MAKQTILWTTLPFGRAPDGRWCVSVLVAPRLTPETAAEQVLKAFPEFLDWPKTLDGAGFELAMGADVSKLEMISKPQPDLWGKLFTDQTPVAGFTFKDMSTVNLRSYSVRNILGFLRHYYGKLAVNSSGDHPALLPWKTSQGDLKGMLSDLGTRTQSFPLADRTIEVALPGFSRFFSDDSEKGIGSKVFGPNGVYQMPVSAIGAEEAGTPQQAGQATRRVMASDWYDPRPGGPNTPLVAKADAALMANFQSADEYAFYQADRFYRRVRPTDDQLRMRRPDYKNIPDAPKLPDFDFHRIVASFGDTPAVLRALGLVLDFAIVDGAILDSRLAAGGGKAVGQMGLRLGWSNGHNPGDDSLPKTAWAADKQRFYTRPRSTDQDRGLLKLEGSDDDWGTMPDKKPGLFDLYQVDPDGAALKTVNFTLTAQNLVAKSLSVKQSHGEVTYTTGDTQPVAALRSGGLGVSRHGRAAAVAQDAAAAALKNQSVAAGQGDKVVMFAEDVLRGYRVDVSPVPDTVSAGKWFSLNARSGAYKLIKSQETLDLPADEGHVGGASTTSSPDGPPDDHYLHESLFRWTGWSLSAPRFGLTLRAETAPDSQVQGEVPSTITDEATNGNGLSVSFRPVKGSLPKLRFGQLYRFRARMVDSAGNSLAVDDATLDPLEGASDAVGYWRFEPVDPPAVVHRARVSEGETLERMVIRSNYNADPATYVASPDFTAAAALPASQDFAYGPVNERHFVPPKSSQLQCETHGAFDPYFADWTKIKDGYAIAAREAGTLYDNLPGAQVQLITPATLAEIATTVAVPPALPDATNPVGDRLAGGQYVIHAEAQVTTPYLPDVAADGIALRASPGHSLPGVTGQADLGPSCVIRFSPAQELVILVKHGKDWPDTLGFRLILAERTAALTEMPCAEAFPDDGAPKWDEASRTLTLFVSKGRIERLVYASFADPHLIRTFGVPHWTGTGPGYDFCAATAQMGCNWTITPFRPLVLVHATQAPLCPPQLLLLSLHREAGDHTAHLLCRDVRLHGPSSGKFEVEATWHEWIDDIQKDRPERVAMTGQLGEIRLDENHVNDFTLGQAVDDQLADPKAARGDVHQLGDTKFRLIEYRARATTRFREYLPPSIYADRDKVTRVGPIAEGPAMALPAPDDMGAPVLSNPAGSTAQSTILASAPPADPRVLYVVPTFRWSSSVSGATHDMTRLGNGLRVWLDRPWFSSGDGEMLGVVTWAEGAKFEDVPAPMQALVSQWGMDPLWDTGLPKALSNATDFSARVTTDSLNLQEQPNGAPFVQILAHRVHWDDARHLWYCDIELAPGAGYMPFVRLALVRYQPNALPQAQVSKVVLCDFAQVLPRRRAVVSITGAAVSADLYGPSPQFGPMKFPLETKYQNISFPNLESETGRNRVELVLQTRDPAIDSDLAWQDTTILLSEVVAGPGPAGFNPLMTVGAVQPAIAPATRAAIVQAPQTQAVQTRASGVVDLATAVDSGNLLTSGLSRFPFPVDPAFWSGKATLPPGTTPRRLMLREFERFYSDHVLPENALGHNLRKVIEERLVYATIVPIEG